MEFVDVFVTHVVPFINDFKDYQSLMNTCFDLRRILYLTHSKQKSVWEKLEQFKYNHLILQAILEFSSLPSNKYSDIIKVELKLDTIFPLLKAVKIVGNNIIKYKISISKLPKLLNVLSFKNVTIARKHFQPLKMLTHLECDCEYVSESHLKNVQCIVYLNYLGYVPIKLTKLPISIYCSIYNDCVNTLIYKNKKAQAFDIKFKESLDDKIRQKILNECVHKISYYNTDILIHKVNNNHYYTFAKEYVNEYLQLAGKYRYTENLLPNIEQYL